MDCCLIVFQPYRPLVQYCQDLGIEDSVLPTAWRIVSDSLRTDVSLLFPPYLISLSCLHMACVILNKDCRSWFSELIQYSHQVEMSNNYKKLRFLAPNVLLDYLRPFFGEDQKMKCSWGSKMKHCQRHNGPEGWVLLTKVTSLGHITSSYTNLKTLCSKSEQKLKWWSNFTFQICTKLLSTRISSST